KKKKGVESMDKKAKEILRAIIEKANQNKTYYVISKTYWAYSNNWAVKLVGELGVNDKIWDDLYKLNERYERFRHYMKEIKPNWKVIDTIYYADNSITVVEQNKQGEKRRRMTVAPSGDAC